MPTQFNPERLSDARYLRGLTASSLASDAGVSPNWLSKVERGHEIPSSELVDKLARTLKLPAAFFYEYSVTLPDVDAFYFRATSKLARKDASAARAISRIALQIADWLETTYSLPAPAIPEIQELSESEMEFTPEAAADLLRIRWGLGSAPISSMLALLESRGARVFAVSGGYQAIDAYSFRRGPGALIFLNPSKSIERLRFDLAHELGHLVLHGGSLHGVDSKERERQANAFASAFLMPRGGFVGSIRGDVVGVDPVLALRDRWRVSSMAVARRLSDLGVLSDWTYRSICQELARRGYRRSEPGSRLAPEVSSLWSQVLADLRSQGLGVGHLAAIVNVKPDDIRSLLAGIVPLPIAGGALSSEASRASLRLVGAR